jgi:osmotically-inducible protein OsmY
LQNERISTGKIDSLNPLATPTPDQMGTSADATLQDKIQSALRHDPTLTHDSVRVSVLSDSIELTGSVGNSRERLTATRLAMSFAGSRRVVTRITVGGASDAPLQASPAKKNATGNQKVASPLKAN